MIRNNSRSVKIITENTVTGSTGVTYGEIRKLELKNYLVAYLVDVNKELKFNYIEPSYTGDLNNIRYTFTFENEAHELQVLGYKPLVKVKSPRRSRK